MKTAFLSIALMSYAANANIAINTFNLLSTELGFTGLILGCQAVATNTDSACLVSVENARTEYERINTLAAEWPQVY